MKNGLFYGLTLGLIFSLEGCNNSKIETTVFEESSKISASSNEEKDSLIYHYGGDEIFLPGGSIVYKPKVDTEATRFFRKYN
jgi:hypothetical protein